tara:strand:- start:95 stop:334 length:240 start_codon:yes stop_codon:yes gene_type:complete
MPSQSRRNITAGTGKYLLKTFQYPEKICERTSIKAQNQKAWDQLGDASIPHTSRQVLKMQLLQHTKIHLTNGITAEGHG